MSSLDPDTGQKQCTKCTKTKPADDFARSSGTADGLRFWCKSCDSNYQAKWRAKHAGPCPIEGCKGCFYRVGGKQCRESKWTVCKWHHRGESESECGCKRCSNDRRSRFDPATGLKTCDGCENDLQGLRQRALSELEGRAEGEDGRSVSERGLPELPRRPWRTTKPRLWLGCLFVPRPGRQPAYLRLPQVRARARFQRP